MIVTPASAGQVGRRAAWATVWTGSWTPPSSSPTGHHTYISSVVDPNTLNLDPDTEFWPNLDPDPGL